MTTHWQHGPHQAPAMVTEFTIDHSARTLVTSSYTCLCKRADCKGVPPGLTCECAPPRDTREEDPNGTELH